MELPERGVEQRVFTDDGERVLKQLLRADVSAGGEGPHFVTRPQVALVGAHVRDWPRRQPAFFVRRRHHGERADDAARETLLHGEQVVERAAHLVRPDGAAIGRVHEPSRYAERVRRALDASLDDEADAELARHGDRIVRGVPESHCRSARDDPHRAHRREIGDQLVRQSVGQISVPVVGTETRERQHRDRWPPPAGERRVDIGCDLATLASGNLTNGVVQSAQHVLHVGWT